MKLHEYQSKNLFATEKIPIPQGKLASTPLETKQIAEELGFPVVLKAQVLVGGRGKAGGIRLVKNSSSLEEEAAKIFSNTIKGFPVRNILIDKAISIQQELYLGITVDRLIGKPVIIASGDGGIDIEEIARDKPERIIKSPIDPLLGIRDYQIRDLAAEIDLPRENWREFITIAKNLWVVFNKYDATTSEINPLVITTDGHFVALDGKITIDDNALIRHRDFLDIRDVTSEKPDEFEARKFGLSYIRLDGNIGCLVNGAGLAMATMDNIKLMGGNPANFLDIGGGANAEKVNAALRIILQDSAVKAVLINIFGGITRCDEVAKGIISALAEFKTKIPMVVRLVGTNADEGKNILNQVNLITTDSLFEAAKIAVEITESTK